VATALAVVSLGAIQVRAHHYRNWRLGNERLMAGLYRQPMPEILVPDHHEVPTLPVASRGRLYSRLQDIPHHAIVDRPIAVKLPH
jgi:hypothetical protein